MKEGSVLSQYYTRDEETVANCAGEEVQERVTSSSEWGIGYLKKGRKKRGRGEGRKKYFLYVMVNVCNTSRGAVN